ncbi:MAG: ABC transporter permease, partial [Paracoccaceae bacterium]|nr:ABC transporter permease [Paracoccaceae bacterium]
MDKMPRWADVALIPLINILLAFILAGLVVLAIGQNPFDMVYFMIKGALGSTRGIGYTLYYTTNFIFTGLAFSVAMHAKLFNIGGEGQAAVGGIGTALVLLAVPWPHWTLALP